MNIKKYFNQNKIDTCKQNFIKNNFNFFLTENIIETKDLIISKIIPELKVKTASWGDPMTVLETGLIKELERSKDIKFVQTFDNLISKDEILQRRKKALTVDLFITGSNAITEKGQLVNLDMLGNRVAPMIFGPKFVLVIVGRNKIVPDISQAINRIKNHVAPLNAKRIDTGTPCNFTGKCTDCHHGKRICNYWSVIEKSYPPNRISIILINQELGI